MVLERGQGHADGLLFVPKHRTQPPLSPPPSGTTISGQPAGHIHCCNSQKKRSRALFEPGCCVVVVVAVAVVVVVFNDTSTRVYVHIAQLIGTPSSRTSRVVITQSFVVIIDAAVPELTSVIASANCVDSSKLKPGVK